MTAPAHNASFYADFGALAALKRDAREESPQALRQAAQQFESLFTEMMLKSMRAASFGDALTGGDEVEFYQSMFDQQMATHLSKGKGLGLADMLVQQLMRSGWVPRPNGAGDDDAGLKSDPPSMPIAEPAVSGTRPKVDHAWPPASPEEFAQRLLPHAETAARQLGVDPVTLVAHAALETGWGRHVPCNADGSSSFNLFGIKSTRDWQGVAVAASTLEYEQGRPVQQVARFRSYASLSDCFADYAQLLGGHSRYEAAVNAGGDVRRFAQGLQRGGYATDPAYANKLTSVASRLSELLKYGGVTPIDSGGGGT